jgi:hypothetical protein
VPRHQAQGSQGLQINGQERSIEFSDGPHNCIAVLKPGPVWLAGYTYMMHASICRTDTAPVQAQDIAYVLARCKLGLTTWSAI